MSERMVRPNELERMAPLSKGYASRLTGGRDIKMPTVEMLNRIEAALGTTRAWLEEGKGPPLGPSQSDRPGYDDAEALAYEADAQPDWAVAGVRRLPWKSVPDPAPIAPSEILKLAEVVKRKKLRDVERKQLDREARDANGKRRAKRLEAPIHRPSRPAGKGR